MTVTHIVFGDSAFGNLKHAFQQRNEKIICVNDDFSIGSLNFTDGMRARKKWLKEVLTSTGQESNLDYVEWVEAKLKQNPKIEEVPSNSKVVLWYGENVSDVVGVSYVVALLQDKGIEFSAVNVTDFSRRIDYKVQDEQGKELSHTLKSLAEVPSEFILGAIQMEKELSLEQVQELVQDWENYSQSNGLLRVLENGKIVTVSEDYYDTTILEQATQEYQQAVVIVGEVMNKIEQRMGDTYLNFRVQQLIKQGKLISKGNFSKTEIRLP